MSSDWPAIRYRDFYDIPRAVVVEWRDRLYLFDCLYDYDVDDYDSRFAVFLLPDELKERIDEISWTDLDHLGIRVGSVAVSEVEFDETRRRSLNPAVFDQLELG